MNATAQVYFMAESSQISLHSIYKHRNYLSAWTPSYPVVKLQLRSEGIEKRLSIMATKIAIYYNSYLSTDVFGQGEEGVAVFQPGLPGCREQPCCSRSSHTRCLHSPAAWPGPAVPTEHLPWSCWVLGYGHTAKGTLQGAKGLLDLKREM